MSRRIYKWAAIIQLGLVLFTGCHPTQPFFLARDDAMANYIAQSMEIEYADVAVDSLPEATLTQDPFGPSRLPDRFRDLSLEDCVSYALANAKIIRVVNGSNLQSGSVAAALLSATPGQMPSVWDPALVATTASTQPLTIDNQGNRVAPRGAIRANQVGGVEDALSEFDAQFSAIMGYNTTDRPRNVGQGNVFNPQFFQAVDANGQLALSKRVATGTIATTRFTTVYSRNNIPASGNAPGSTNFGRAVPSDYTSAIELQVTQPLLRGRGTLVNRIPVVLARINEDIELHRFEANVRNLVRAVEHAYWDLYCGYRAFESAKIAQESALELWRITSSRTQLGPTPPEAEKQAAALYAQFTAQVNVALYGTSVPGNDPSGLYGRERILRELMGFAATDGELLRPSDEPTTARIQFDWNEVQSEALTRSTELRLQKWAIKQRELELIGLKNQILPQLDVVAFYRWLGVGDQFASANRNGLSFPDPGSTALEELTGGDYQEIGFRAEFTPQAFGKRRALANIQNSQIQITKFKDELREKEIQLMNQLSTGWSLLESNYVSIKNYFDEWQAHEEEIDVYRNQIELAQRAADDLGRVTDNLLRAEERRSRAQLRYYQAVCEYNKSIVNIHYLKGSILDLNNISLAEGPWVDKAYWDAEERSKERASGIYFDYGYTRPGVVSNGPVESGLPTEGNITRDQVTLPEPLDDSGLAPEELVPPSTEPRIDDDGELPSLPERPGPVAQSSPSAPVVSPAAATGSAVAPFDWGSMQLESEPAPVLQAAPRRANPSGRTLPTSRTHPPAQSGWRTR